MPCDNPRMTSRARGPEPDLVARAHAARQALGSRAVVLGHHHQRDEVFEFADVTGDSFTLARDAAHRPDAEFVVSCGARSLAENADILTARHQQVVLPGPAAGRPAADAAAISEVEAAWEQLDDLGVAQDVVPVTAMDSSAATKAFTGRNGGTVCTSSTAATALSWAFEQRPAGRGKVLFLPGHHLGRNTAVRSLGLATGDCVVYDPHEPGGGLTEQQLRAARMILWPGCCPVHDRFSAQHVAAVRERVPGVQVIVHPGCRLEVVTAADRVGSTEQIIRTIEAAPAGSSWAVGTDPDLVRRLARLHPELDISDLDPTACPSTPDRIDLPHLVRQLESLAAGRVTNRVVVDDEVAHWARVALDQMLALPA